MATKPLVLVTGASGFVGAHVLASLLHANYRVLSTLRTQHHIDFLSRKYASHIASQDLSFALVPDIQAPHALDDPAQQADYICHLASPYFTSATDPWAELVQPAVQGTRNVLASASAARRVRRVVVLSSFAAVNDINDLVRPGYVYTEADWNPVTEAQAHEDGVKGYFASKTFAEMEAWKFWKEEKPGWDLVTLCPPMIYGPAVHEVNAAKGVNGLGTSLKGLLTGLMGKTPGFAPKVATPSLPPSVDVRDVAGAHVKALGLSSGTSERFLLCQGLAYLEDGLTGLRKQGEEDLGEEGEKIDLKKHYTLDTRKAEETLGITWIPFTKTVEDTWTQAKADGLLKV